MAGTPASLEAGSRTRTRPRQSILATGTALDDPLFRPEVLAPYVAPIGGAYPHAAIPVRAFDLEECALFGFVVHRGLLRHKRTID